MSFNVLEYEEGEGGVAMEDEDLDGEGEDIIINLHRKRY